MTIPPPLHELAARLSGSYGSYRSPAFGSRRIPPDLLHETIDAIAASSKGLIRVAEAGRSYEKRPIRICTAGSGPVPVLLWTQMHGDESTATMAVVDILTHLAAAQGEAETRRLLSALTLHVLPMLNPDGAARFQRRTAQGIDMNRDAIALRTPEARVLHRLRTELAPHFGFNLHDQELSTVGASKELSMLALLAPAFDAGRTDNPVRARAKRLAATLAGIAGVMAPRNLSRYDDAYEPRAFGDTMQHAGTSTVLIESGHAPGDPGKDSIRKLNYVAILGGLHALAAGITEDTPVALYEELPFNGKKAYDIIIRNIAVAHEGGGATPADIAVSYQVDTHSESTPVLADMGDLSTCVGVREIEGGGKPVPQPLLTPGRAFAWEDFFHS